ncbi:unnamed protein product [Didymodactylos carnosus]|uniref:Uncharacterized protein n=1 Tax=Didymodactylos carnosus TaxID=1234261 RepID=A0A814NZF3_9BILA|nr:unnamed protein product [Didymodactylos carnosus]CAF3863560.1 unnamed protein product [Didymodactylos carnosus]
MGTSISLLFSSKYKTFFDLSTEDALIPDLSQGWVPQALGYIPEKKWLLVTNYNDDKKTASSIAVIDSITKTFIKRILLAKKNGDVYTGHAGGIAVSKTNVFISSNKSLYQIEISAIIAASDNSTIKFVNQFSIDTQGSFAYFDLTDNILWAGDFVDGKDEKQQPKLVGYKLNINDTLNNSRLSATYTWNIPVKIQGMVIINDKCVFSQSYGRASDSKLIIANKGYNGKQLKTITLTPLSEGLSYHPNSNDLFIIFESAAQQYLDGGTYPLKNIYKINVKKLFKDIA